MECYKVVSKKYRYGTNATGFISKQGMIAFKTILNDYPAIKKYFPKYKKGTIVESVKGSVEILCFNNKENANDFITFNLECLNGLVQIIKVNGVQKMNSSYIKSGGMGIRPFVDMDNHYYARPPIGTLFFKKVEVLE